MKLNLMKNICCEIQPHRGCGCYVYDSDPVNFTCNSNSVSFTYGYSNLTTSWSPTLQKN